MTELLLSGIFIVCPKVVRSDRPRDCVIKKHLWRLWRTGWVRWRQGWTWAGWDNKLFIVLRQIWSQFLDCHRWRRRLSLQDSSQVSRRRNISKIFPPWTGPYRGSRSIRRGDLTELALFILTYYVFMIIFTRSESFKFLEDLFLNKLFHNCPIQSFFRGC